MPSNRVLLGAGRLGRRLVFVRADRDELAVADRHHVHAADAKTRAGGIGPGWGELEAGRVGRIRELADDSYLETGVGTGGFLVGATDRLVTAAQPATVLVGGVGVVVLHDRFDVTTTFGGPVGLGHFAWRAHEELAPRCRRLGEVRWPIVGRNVPNWQTIS